MAAVNIFVNARGRSVEKERLIIKKAPLALLRAMLVLDDGVKREVVSTPRSRIRSIGDISEEASSTLRKSGDGGGSPMERMPHLDAFIGRSHLEDHSPAL